MLIIKYNKELDMPGNIAASCDKLGWKVLGASFPTDYNTTVDMLAFDAGGVPLIVQIKRRPSDNIALEALSYYNNITGHKSGQGDLMAQSKYPEITKLHWDRARLILFAPSYNDYDIDTITSFPITVDAYIYSIFDDSIIIAPQYIPVADYPEEEEAAYSQLKDSLGNDNRAVLNEIEQFTHELDTNIKRITVGETIRYYEVADLFTIRADKGDIILDIAGESYNSQKSSLMEVVRDKIKYGK